MKKLLYILLFVPFALFGQSIISVQQDSYLEFYQGWNMFGYSCYEPIDVALSFTSIEDKIVIVKDNSGNVYMPEFGFNGIGSLERNRGYQIKLTEAISDFQFCPFLVPLVVGCTDETAFNYNPNANSDDGSCQFNNCFYPPDPEFVSWLQENTPEVMNEDCLDIDLANTIEMNGLQLTGVFENIDGVQYFTNLSFLQIWLNDNLTSIPELSGLTNLNDLIIEYNDNLTSIPELSGLTNLNSLYIEGNDIFTSLPELSGLTNLNQLVIFNCDNLISVPDLSGLTNLNYLDISSNDSLISVPDLSGLTNLNNLYITDNDKLISVPELSGLTNLNTLYISHNDNLISIPEIYGPTNLFSLSILNNLYLTSLPDLSGLTNLNYLYIHDNNNLECVFGGYPEQLTIDEDWPPVCEEEVTYQVGDLAEGGIVFYVDETGQHGLVAAMEDLEETYHWGCYGDIMLGADQQGIGFGLQNTNEILLSCSDRPIAASVALDYQFNEFSDWYLPSKDELRLIYTDIGNIDGFVDNFYWSSSENDSVNYGWGTNFSNGWQTVTNYSEEYTAYVRPIRAFGNWNEGCVDETACNFNPEANMADGSCTYAQEGYDCDGNITEYIVGMQAEGGIVFYVDETGQHGLVAAMEDLTEGATDPYEWGYDGYEWGCYQLEVNGADGTSIGTGYQNTLDIVNYGCTTENGGITAAQASLDFESESFDDWYLPSVDELEELNNTLGTFGQPTNIGGFEESMYFSSSEYSNNPTQIAWYVMFLLDISTNYNKGTLLKVRPIRAFGNWTIGCMDSLACNYNPEANMADGSCEYANLGYDCNGNITEYVVGMQAEGGIVFYVDETGQHGLVAALEDLTEDATIDSEGNPGYQWGCFATWLSGADGQAIGTGYQNTLDIVAGCSETPIAASEALAYESEDYSDWYLPSLDELNEMYNTIGNGGSEGNIGSFSSNWYWSSSESNNYGAYDVNFGDGSTGSFSSKTKIVRVRVIRSF